MSGYTLPHIRRNLALTAILVAFIGLGLAYSVINPLHEATDELRHYRFVRHLILYRRLPVQGQEECRSQSHHAPLFYVLGAVATGWIETGRDLCYEPPANPFWAYRYWEVGRDNKNQYLHGPDEEFPWRGEALAAHLLRAMNVLVGAGVVWLTWAAGRALWPQRPALALGATAFVAFNPMFLYLAGAINNDVLAAFSGAAVTLACLHLLRDPQGIRPRWGVWLGGLLGLALLSKFSLAAVILPIEVAMTWVAWPKRQWRAWLSANTLVVVIAAALAGWWFVRNQLLYDEPTGFQMVTELWGVRDPADSVGLAISELPYFWSSLWGRFGFGQIPLPQAIYTGLFGLTIVGGLGLLLDFGFWILDFGLGRRHLPSVRRPPSTVSTLLFLLLDVLVFFGVVFSYMLVSPAGALGRFFFPALPAFALLLFYGLSRILDFGFWILDWAGSKIQNPKSKIEGLVALAFNLGMAIFALVALFGYLAPAYGRPPSFAADAPIPHLTDAQFDFFATLRGHQVNTTSLRPGEPIDIDLYWEVTGQPPGDYLLFVHLVDEAGTLVAQRDTHPGLGNFPSSQWRPGDRFLDSIRLYVPETAYTPAVAALRMGLYAPGGYRVGITGADGQSLGDALTLAEIRLEPMPGPYPNTQRQNFSNEILLVGYEYSHRVARPGDALVVTLYWESLQRVAADYLVEVRLVDEAGRVWATADSRPQVGQSPTDSWLAGQLVTDRHTLTIGDETPAGSYQVEIALRDAASQTRQNIVGDDGHWIDDQLWLARVMVRR